MALVDRTGSGGGNGGDDGVGGEETGVGRAAEYVVDMIIGLIFPRSLAIVNVAVFVVAASQVLPNVRATHSPDDQKRQEKEFQSMSSGWIDRI